MENSLFILQCVFPACLSVTTVAFNAVAILALRRTLALPKNFKLLLLSMAVSDVGVSLLVQPLYVAITVIARSKYELDTYLVILKGAYFFATNFICAASLIGVTALAADRFLAIHLHLRYHEFVTYNRVVFVVILIWMSSAVIGLLFLWDLSVGFASVPVTTIVCLVVITLFYLKIYLAVKYHTEQIAAMQAFDGGEINKEKQRNAEKQKKAAITIFCVYLVLVVCYLPNLILTCIRLADEKFTTAKSLLFFNDLLIFLNSSLNPLIYCWKMKHIQHAVRNILVNIFSCLS
ncbi:unnamed protein product [Porites evermanni]|uniref:G-protein coupled receptors family 1 profile domain-containing protein n=1 Tax=Porites evermanni TaxID=104178 RepID=A0ABN8S7B6_9CNID|nr:unnamed protein product [Porites evermanni]